MGTMAPKEVAPPRPAWPEQLAPLAVYLVCAALLGDWLIDDSGISYAYARNWAAGHGLVSQPGRPPVEGFSDFLWVLLLAPILGVHRFDPTVLLKALGGALALGALGRVRRPFRAAGREGAGLVAALLLAAAPPLVIWSVSGLENGLTLLLVVTLWATAVERPRGWPLRAGLLSGLLGAAHPGGLVFAASGALLFGVELARRARPAREIARDLGLHAAGAALVLGPLLRYRLAVFGLPVPFTYYAKRMTATPGERLAAMRAEPGVFLAKLVELLRGALGATGPVVVALAALGLVILWRRGRLPRTAGVAAALAAIGAAGYVFQDEDWMGEHRFGTTSVAMLVIGCVALADAAAQELGAGPPRLGAGLPPLGLRAAAVAWVALAYASYLPRTVAFAANPPAPFSQIERSFARKIGAYADFLGLARGSMFLPDVGAPLTYARLTVYDAAGLCEPDLIHTRKHDTPQWLGDPAAFYDWLFERLRPTFIATHDFWTVVAAPERDPRFARDYVAVDAYEDAYALRVFHVRLRSGVFVRRDALGDPARLTALRERYLPPPRQEPLVVRLGEQLRAAWSGRPEGVLELHDAAHAALADDPNRAATLFARLLSRAPRDLDAAVSLAWALDAAFRPDEARVAWRRVAELTAGEDSLAAAMARTRLGP
jgi:hypothetical protein